eukprot:CAMPEP_0185911270 /NCGR_PEP_ID=MMETSP0196C-20130402/26969_1 /TAXON_ID=2932 /ORGANISM="Alexandrium fundyense, Strain CCMP1719" /LENGTH=59 /DNA_ID=CAMNT_0028632277 /DNA_START=38 /DNA_END=214 /DNA_ORIENTATION=-
MQPVPRVKGSRSTGAPGPEAACCDEGRQEPEPAQSQEHEESREQQLSLKGSAQRQVDEF